MTEPEDDGAGETDGCEEGVRAPVVVHGDASPLCQSADHDRDAVALAVERRVVWDGLLAVRLRGNAGGNALLGERGAKRVAVVASVGDQLGRRGAWSAARPG